MSTTAIITALFVDGMAGVSGAVLPERWLERHTATLVSFAVGALLAAAFLDALPESVAALGPRALTCALIGFLSAMVAEMRWGRDHNVPITLLAYVLAFASGSFIYLGAVDLLPELRSESLGLRIGAIASGVGSIALANRLFQ